MSNASTIFPNAHAEVVARQIQSFACFMILPLVAYGIFAVPLGMSVDRFMLSGFCFITGLMSLVIFALFLGEDSRLFGVPFGQGAADEISECLISVVFQIMIGANAVAMILIGFAVAAGA